MRLTFTNDDRGRNIYLDRLDVRNAAGRLVDSLELEELGPSGDCNHAGGDHFGLYCTGSVAVPIDVPRRWYPRYRDCGMGRPSW